MQRFRRECPGTKLTKLTTMIDRLPKIDSRKGLKVVLIAQLAMAGLLIVSDIFEKLPNFATSTTELPSGPISPGDQRREYRLDRPNPGMVTLDEPLDLPLPESFSNRLSFSEHLVEGFGNVLLLSGEIEVGDAARFSSHLTGLPNMPDFIALHSPGGVVFEALEIGKEIRQQELGTAVFAGSFCVSSCPYVLSGGTERIVSLKGIVGLHQHYYEQPGYMPVFLAVEDIQSGQGRTMKHLIEMGVEPALMLYSLSTPPEEIYALIEDELVETRIATKIIE